MKVYLQLCQLKGTVQSDYSLPACWLTELVSCTIRLLRLEMVITQQGIWIRQSSVQTR
jgi:hypothetical protein